VPGGLDLGPVQRLVNLGEHGILLHGRVVVDRLAVAAGVRAEIGDLASDLGADVDDLLRFDRPGSVDRRQQVAALNLHRAEGRRAVVRVVRVPAAVSCQDAQ
jgi:hypothetical protein